MVRTPAVSGQFYPGKPSELRSLLNQLIPACERKKAIGLISPHAGYVYSGAIAGETFAGVDIPSRIVILGPNHHGYGHDAAIYPEGEWVTPIGRTPVDEELADEILASCRDFTRDETAHRFEHSLEVQLPFIQVLAPDASIVPICIGRASLPQLLAMGTALGDVLSRHPGEVLMVASSDMTHYESGDSARRKDMKALEKILALDPAGLYKTVAEGRITMCGVMPSTIMLQAARIMGAQSGRLVRYGNSGDVTGDQAQVVGYAGVVIS